MSPLAPNASALVCICAHYRSEHEENVVGARCRHRDTDGVRCDCPGFEEDPHQQED